jgi:hypothetical protein
MRSTHGRNRCGEPWCYALVAVASLLSSAAFAATPTIQIDVVKNPKPNPTIVNIASVGKLSASLVVNGKKEAIPPTASIAWTVVGVAKDGAAEQDPPPAGDTLTVTPTNAKKRRSARASPQPALTIAASSAPSATRRGARSLRRRRSSSRSRSSMWPLASIPTRSRSGLTDLQRGRTSPRS